MTDQPTPQTEAKPTWRLVIGGIPERSMADGIRMVLGDGDDVPGFLTFAVEAEAAAQARTEGLDGDAARMLDEALG